MGVFTEQVQGLVSEAKIKREKQERKELLREKREEAERDLYYKLENLFTCNSFIRKNVVKNFETKKDIYNFLLLLPVKSKLLQEVTKDIDTSDRTRKSATARLSEVRRWSALTVWSATPWS